MRRGCCLVTQRGWCSCNCFSFSSTGGNGGCNAGLLWYLRCYRRQPDCCLVRRARFLQLLTSSSIQSFHDRGTAICPDLLEDPKEDPRLLSRGRICIGQSPFQRLLQRFQHARTLNSVFGPVSMHFDVCLQMAYTICTSLDNLLLESVPEQRKYRPWLRRGMCNNRGDSSL